MFRALVHEVGAEARRRVRAARHAAATPQAFVEDAYRAYFSFIVEDAGRAAETQWCVFLAPSFSC